MKEGYPMYTNHDKFHAALTIARAHNDADALKVALEAYHDAAMADEKWTRMFIIKHGNCKPCNRIEERKLLNPYTDDIRSWSWDDIKTDILLRDCYGQKEALKEKVLELMGNKNNFHSMVAAYATALRSIAPAPDRISGVYMMFQRDMGEGFCVKIGASDDCAARQSQYFTHNPFAIKGECMSCDNPKEMEKRFHEWFRTMGYENIKTSREWFAIDKGLYKALKNDGFDAIMCQWEE